ncbi:MAG: aminodeoxychorismate synthase component I [Desulfuromonadaceae bacterium]|nr:aminodeoxychorismate synthase component I [Desulfuromonadaceae bacterium]
MPEAPAIFFDSFVSGHYSSSWRFDGYVMTVAASCHGEVPGVLKQVEQAAADGLYAAGFVAYEAAPVLNPDLPSVPHLEGLPLVWFALFRERSTITSERGHLATSPEITLEASRNIDQYSADVARIRRYIAAGDCYQVNHTFSLQETFTGNDHELYTHIALAQQSPFCAYLDIGRFAILSASPELFFSLKNGCISTRPMKGTARRGRWAGEDIDAIERMRNNGKERAENLMIVDLLRNDLGIVAETGSVSVDALFEIETYPTVHQMTSSVSAHLQSGTCLTDIFRALFPCGSVTGAPKRRSMEIIAEIEGNPRGVYCGAIGCVAPGGEAVFSVAIRTLLLDRQNSLLTMGVGSAVTWDSEAPSEYDEYLSKGAFVNQQGHDFRLIESLRLEESGAYTLLDRHLARLKASAEYFGFAWDAEKIRQTLSNHAAQTNKPCKVRLLLGADGSVESDSETLIETSRVLRVGISCIRINSTDSFRYHKTSCREIFNEARASCPDCDEVILLNEHGQLTEGSYHSLVVKLDGRLVTPALACGLLPGVLREELLEKGTIAERILYPADLKRAAEVWLINSVRGWRPCVVI